MTCGCARPYRGRSTGARSSRSTRGRVWWRGSSSRPGCRVPPGWATTRVRTRRVCDVLLNGQRTAAVNNDDLSLFDDPAINDRIERAMGTEDDSTRARLWREIDRAVMEQAPVVPMSHVFESRLYGLWLGGWYRHPTRILKLEDLFVKRGVALVLDRPRRGSPPRLAAAP